MADPFVAEIRVFAFTLGGQAPKGWAYCDGALLPLSQNTPLFALLGTTYGGNGKSNFALPNLQGSVAVHPNPPQAGNGIGTYDLGQMGGSETVTLLESEMPIHTHALVASGGPGNRTTPVGNSIARTIGATPYAAGNPALVTMAPQALAPAGSSFPHNNMMPYLTVVFCIALQGVYPQRP